MPKDKDYNIQLRIQAYGKERKKEIRDFVKKHQPDFQTLTEAIETIKALPIGKTLYAIIEPEIVATLDYSPIRQVARIREVQETRSHWLTDYWLTKYEIELESFGDWKHEIGLIFWSGGYYNFENDVFYPGRCVYDYPSNLIATFLLVPNAKL